MGNSLRCCLACVLPCGVLDLIRIVHLNGYVEEITHPITAGEVLKANPNHVLSKPSSHQGSVRKILIVSPDSELKRGSIYFLIPAASLPAEKKTSCAAREHHHNHHHRHNLNSHRKVKKYFSCKKKRRCVVDADTLSAKYDSQVTEDTVSEKKSPSRRNGRRRSSSGVWRPHLESIFED